MAPYLKLGNIWTILTFSLITFTISAINTMAQEPTDSPQEDESPDVTVTVAPEITTVEETTIEVPTTEPPPSEPIINIAYYYQERDSKKSFDAAIDYIKQMYDSSFKIGSITEIFSDGTKTPEQLCSDLEGKTLDIVIDFTRQGEPSEPVKTMVRNLQLPTIAGSFGQEGDIKAWRELQYDEAQYLIQVSPPADVVVQVMRSVVDLQNMTSGVLLFDEQYDMYHKYKSLLQNMPCRHLLTKVVRDIPGLRRQIDRLVHVDVANYFIAASNEEITQYLIEASDPDIKDGPYFSDEFAWYSISLEEGFPTCVGCRMNTSLVHLQPRFDYLRRTELERIKYLEKTQSLRLTKLTEIFYFDLVVSALLSVGNLKMDKNWAAPAVINCNGANSKPSENYENKLWTEFEKQAKSESNTGNILGQFNLGGNGWNYPMFKMKFNRMLFYENALKPYSNKEIGYWTSGFGEKELLSTEVTEGLRPHVALTVFRVVTVVQPPFVYRNESCIESQKAKYASNDCYYGYCIDLLKTIVADLHFNWTIRNVSEYGYMDDNEPHEWSGMIRELKDRRADIALGALSVMAERESVVDFTVPYYDLVGISVLIKKQKQSTSLFKFLTVLENDVWMCILGSYFFTSFIIYVYDRWSPMSYYNNSEAYPNEEDQRDFNMKECLWFCMTSLTPQGGGEAPKNLSGRIVSAIWWLFGFIIIASYTANLAAFLTVSRLDAPVESLDDLAKQYKVQYAPVRNSPSWIYFQRMSNIEHRFTDVWTRMNLDDSLTEYEKAQISVYNYPISMKYTHIFEAMKYNKPPKNFEEGYQRILGNRHDISPDDFAMLAEATEVKYMKATDCRVKSVGDEFSRKPYAIAVQKGSPLKESFSHMILKLLNKRSLEYLKDQWWGDENPLTRKCPREESNADGISIQNIGGVFIVIFVGIILACITLIFEYWWYRKRDVSVELAEMTLPTPKEYVSYFAQHERTEFDADYNDMPRGRPDVSEIQPSW